MNAIADNVLLDYVHPNTLLLSTSKTMVLLLHTLLLQRSVVLSFIHDTSQLFLYYGFSLKNNM